MRKILLANFCVAVLVSSVTLASSPVSACDIHGNCDHHKGAPGPLAAAGLPFLAIAYGAFWVFKRRRMTDWTRNIAPLCFFECAGGNCSGRASPLRPVHPEITLWSEGAKQIAYDRDCKPVLAGCPSVVGFPWTWPSVPCGPPRVSWIQSDHANLLGRRRAHANISLEPRSPREDCKASLSLSADPQSGRWRKQADWVLTLSGDCEKVDTGFSQ